MQMMVLFWLAVVLLGAFVLYPRLMIGLAGSLIRGLFTLMADTVALLFAWI